MLVEWDTMSTTQIGGWSGGNQEVAHGLEHGQRRKQGHHPPRLVKLSTVTVDAL